MTETTKEKLSVFDRIRESMLNGEFHPGQWLRQQELEQSYDTNRSEVRAALNKLSERGMIEYVQNRGFRIFDRSAEEIAEVTEFLSIIESAAAESIVKNCGTDELEKLVALSKSFDDLIETGTHVELRLANFHFHRALNALSSNKLMQKTSQNLREGCIVGPFDRYMTLEGLRKSSKEHANIIQAISDKDVARLQSYMADHAQNTN